MVCYHREYSYALELCDLRIMRTLLINYVNRRVATVDPLHVQELFDELLAVNLRIRPSFPVIRLQEASESQIVVCVLVGYEYSFDLFDFHAFEQQLQKRRFSAVQKEPMPT